MCAAPAWVSFFLLSQKRSWVYSTGLSSGAVKAVIQSCLIFTTFTASVALAGSAYVIKRASVNPEPWLRIIPSELPFTHSAAGTPLSLFNGYLEQQLVQELGWSELNFKVKVHLKLIMPVLKISVVERWPFACGAQSMRKLISEKLNSNVSLQKSWPDYSRQDNPQTLLWVISCENYCLFTELTIQKRACIY